MTGEPDDGNDGDSIYDACASCGASFTVGDWHPVVTETNEAGDREFYSFCDDGCRSAWTDEHGHD